MNAITNMIICMKSDANDEVKLAKELAKIPCVEVSSIKVWSAPTEEETGLHRSVEFMGLHGKFRWHDHTINIDENYNGKIIVSYDGTKIGEVFWSALWGKLESLPNYTEVKIAKAQDYILDCIWKAIHNISAKGRPNGKVALPKKVVYGDCTIWAEGATVFAKCGEDTLRVMGNTWRGLLWTESEPRVTELQKVLKKAFVVY